MKKLKVFISYSHKDDQSRQELDKWLSVLKDKDFIDSWFDGDVIPGERLMDKITKEMEKADVIILMLSQDYLASYFCKEEMKFALSSPQKKAIPIILRECTWLDTGCKELLALPKEGKPVSKWQDREEAWRNVYEGIKKVVSEMLINFEIKSKFLLELQQIEFLTHGKNGAKLEEIFVFPNISLYQNAFEAEKVNEKFFLDNNEKSILIKGREFSGKTALLKWLFSNLREKFSTILLNGNAIHKTLNFDEYLKKEFVNEMDGDFDAWMKLDNKVALIDNFNHRISNKLLEYLNENFVMTILAIDDEEYMLYFKDEPSFAEYATLSLSQFTLVQQEKLIRKWFQLSQQIAVDQVSDVDIDKLESQVDSVITNQRIVPRYPFYILSILQSLETFMPSDVRITAYGHCYQALVTAQLIKKNIKPEDLDTCFNYLRNLAFNIYEKTNGGEIYSEQNYQAFRELYKSKFIVSDALINKVENDDYSILDFRDEQVTFKYSYIYYFFLGMYLAFTESKKIIDELCDEIHLRRNSFILIFTIHHTHNQELLETIRLHCVCSIDKIEPATLSASETQFMNNLIANLPQSIISNKSTEKNRAEQRSRRDDREQEKNKDYSKSSLVEQEEKDEVDRIEVNKGMKIMEVLGQILKNRAGSFERKDVEEILENTIDLGLRILNLLLNEYRKPEFEEWLARMLMAAEKEMQEAHNRQFDDEKRKEFIKKCIQFFGYVVTVGLLNRISGAISTEKLVGTMRILSEKKSTPAYELTNYLVSSSQSGVDIEYIKGLMAEYNKSKNHWAEKVLSHYVQEYLNTHNVNFRDRQRLFQVLNLKYLPNKV
jgi:hypothetical protein